MFFSERMFCQREEYSNKTSSDIKISFHFKDNFFFIDYIDEENLRQNLSSDTEYYNPYAIGIIKGNIIVDNQKRIVCKDKKNNKTYRFKRLNNESLINYDIPILGDTLYLIKKDTEDMFMAGKWRNGKKEGTWIFVPKKGFPYYIHYKMGKVIH